MDICPLHKYCGGCSLQGVSYSKQLQLKQERINNLLGKFHSVNNIIGMSNPCNYRNKVQVSFGYDENHRVICGNYVTSTHTIVQVDDCMICDSKANEIICSIKKLINKYKISVFDEYAYKGCIRHVLIRSTNSNEYMVVLVTGSININRKENFIKDLIKYNPCITTIVQNINNRHTSMILGSKNITLYGKGYVIDKLCGLNFRISPNSFYQVNKYQTEVLYNTAISSLKLNKKDRVIDAYCGTGTIGLVASKYCDNVLGIELNKDAVRDAVTNMKMNRISNVSFICEDASKYMNFLAKEKYKVDALIMDPPRSGCDSKFIDAIFKLNPNKIVYVSCNPDTLKRDLLKITKKYTIKSIQPVDMFPFTDHVETVVLMSRDKE